MATNEVSKFIAPDGNTYHYKDEQARNDIKININDIFSKVSECICKDIEGKNIVITDGSSLPYDIVCNLNTPKDKVVIDCFGANLFNPNTCENGYPNRDNGDIVPYNGNIISDFIKIEGLNILYGSINQISKIIGIAIYDKNKSLIDLISDSDADKISYTNNKNAVWARMWYSQKNIGSNIPVENPQLSFIDTEYVPFNEDKYTYNKNEIFIKSYKIMYITTHEENTVIKIKYNINIKKFIELINNTHNNSIESHSDIRNIINNRMRDGFINNNDIIYSDSIPESLHDLNKLESMSSYIYYTNHGIALKLDNSPTDIIDGCLIVTIGGNKNISGKWGGQLQFFVNISRINKVYFELWVRCSVSVNTWSNWENITGNKKVDINIRNIIEKPINFNNKKIVIFGDSIAKGVTSDTNGSSSISENCFINLFSKHVNATLENLAIPSSSISSYYTGSTPICDVINKYSGSADYVFIAGGVNDHNTGVPLGDINSNDNKTFYGALNNIIKDINNKLPKAKIIFISPTDVLSDMPNKILSMQKYREAIYKIATKNKLMYIGGDTLGLPMYGDKSELSKELMSDNIHPTESGHYLYYQSLCYNLL